MPVACCHLGPNACPEALAWTASQKRLPWAENLSLSRLSQQNKVGPGKISPARLERTWPGKCQTSEASRNQQVNKLLGVFETESLTLWFTEVNSSQRLFQSSSPQLLPALLFCVAWPGRRLAERPRRLEFEGHRAERERTHERESTHTGTLPVTEWEGWLCYSQAKLRCIQWYLHRRPPLCSRPAMVIRWAKLKPLAALL